MPIRAVLFDLDGTLLDSIDGILASFDHVLARYVPDHAFSRQHLIMKIGEPVAKQMLDFSGGDAELAALMAADYRAHNRELLPSMPLFTGTHVTLAELKRRGFVIGIVTSKAKASASLSLDQHGLTAMLDLVLTADDTPLHKPDPMPLIVAARRLGLSAGEIAYVGDSVHDMRCALAAGAVAIAALWGPFDPVALHALSPHHTAASLDELAALSILQTLP